MSNLCDAKSARRTSIANAQDSIEYNIALAIDRGSICTVVCPETWELAKNIKKSLVKSGYKINVDEDGYVTISW